jgi:hypothetical protein
MGGAARVDQCGVVGLAGSPVVPVVVVPVALSVVPVEVPLCERWRCFLRSVVVPAPVVLVSFAVPPRVVPPLDRPAVTELAPVAPTLLVVPVGLVVVLSPLATPVVAGAPGSVWGAVPVVAGPTPGAATVAPVDPPTAPPALLPAVCAKAGKARIAAAVNAMLRMGSLLGSIMLGEREKRPRGG